MAAGGHNAQEGHKNCPSLGFFRHEPLIPPQGLLDVGSLVSLALDLATEPPAAVNEVGVQSRHNAPQFVTKLWFSDCKRNCHLGTCLCDNVSDLNVQSNSFLPEDCMFDCRHPATLVGPSGHSVSGGQHSGYISTHLVAQDLWDAGKIGGVVPKDGYFYRAEMKYDLYVGHSWLRRKRVAPVGHRCCFLMDSAPLQCR